MATTYSEVATSFASRRHSVRTEGSGMSRLADFVFRSDEITGRLCSECHALCTERYGASASRNTQSHFNAKISSRRKPAYRPIITNTYGGSPLMATRSLSTCSSVSAYGKQKRLQLQNKCLSFILRLSSFGRKSFTGAGIDDFAFDCRIENALVQHLNRAIY